MSVRLRDEVSSSACLDPYLYLVNESRGLTGGRSRGPRRSVVACLFVTIWLSNSQVNNLVAIARSTSFPELCEG